jgi:predicted Ser/Thr protein kinase
MSLLFPVWAILFPVWFCLFLVLLLKIPGVLPPIPAAMIVTFLFLVPVLALLATAVSEDDRILLSNAGISFPISFLPGLKFKREFRWCELTSVSLRWEGAGTFQPRDCLDLFFNNCGHARLYLKQMSRSNLEQLILAINLWAGGRGDEHHLLQLQTHLRGGLAEENRLSITQLWEEELAGRFAPTSFETLQPDSYLQANKLRIVKVLGFGGFSATYLAQRNGRELVVLKEAVDRREQSNESPAAKLLEVEAMILAQLSHPQIPRLFDHFVEHDRHYLVLEYVAGQDLRQLVRQNGPQTELDVIAWAMKACEVLDYLHRQDPTIIHLDVTPENLLLKRDGELVLVDFGSAVKRNGKALTVVSGKEAYMAPEQKQERPETGSDIFALGCTLHFLLTGRDPVPPVVASPRSINAAVTSELDELVQKCTEPEASDRICSTEVLSKRLNELKSNHASNPK